MTDNTIVFLLVGSVMFLLVLAVILGSRLDYVTSCMRGLDEQVEELERELNVPQGKWGGVEDGIALQERLYAITRNIGTLDSFTQGYVKGLELRLNILEQRVK